MTVLLAVLLSVQAVRLVLVFFAPMTSVTTPAGVQASAAAAPALPTTDLFYRRASAAAGGNSALGYTLYGVRSDMAGDSAILAGQDGVQQSWPVGREVAPGLVLRSVGPEHVMLESGGAHHRLELAAPAGVVTRAAVPPVATAAASIAVPNAAPAQPSAAAVGTPAPAPDTRTSTTASATGIRVGDTGHAALLQGVGLQPGDELLSVNGQPLSPLRLLRLRDELKGQPELAIEYRRDGRIHTTTFKLPQ